MGCVHCKPTCSLYNESQTSDKMSTEEKGKKNLRAFLKALIFRRKTSKTSSSATATASSQGSTTPNIMAANECLPPTHHESVILEETSEDVIGIASTLCIQTPVEDVDGEETDTDNVDVQQLGAAEGNPHISPAVNTAELRKERYELHILREKQSLLEIKAELELVNDRQDSCANKLQLLTALRNCALQNPNRAGRVSNLDARIEKLKKSYCLYEKKLYKLKGERAVGEAMADHYAAKLNPKLKYTDIYSVKNSYYLSPIPEENEVDLQEFVSGDFPGENNSSLAATTLRNSQLFLDVSSPSDFIH